jgi:hypothetical protein
MDWDMFAWYAFAPQRGGGDPQECAPCPSPLDAWILRTVYTALAEESHCSVCGAALGRVRVVTTDHGASARSLASFATRCRGWRRHRHVAEAVEASGDLVLGPFTATRPRDQP